MNLKPLIFTDLDGTLLDHDSYSHEAADPLIKALQDQNIPLILCSSKTRAEIAALRDEIDSEEPFIVENGAAVFIPQGYFPSQPNDTCEIDGYWVYEQGQRRKHWLKLLDKCKSRYDGQFDHFHAMGSEGIAKATGLAPGSAELANRREYGEPIQWLGSAEIKTQFINELQNEGGHLLQGGRFLHLSGPSDKGKALNWLVSEFVAQYPSLSFKSIALGDSQNDAAMLEAADEAIIIRSPVNAVPEIRRDKAAIVSQAFGPAGWRDSLTQLLTLSFNFRP